jgi:hypothetical protein
LATEKRIPKGREWFFAEFGSVRPDKGMTDPHLAEVLSSLILCDFGLPNLDIWLDR